jgi:heme exporter protein A
MRLVADKLAGERGGETIFSGISFDLGQGTALIVTGPNGVGKSTLLRVLAGLLPVASGAMRFEGGGERFPDVQSALHYLGPMNAMKTALTVEENLSFWRSFNGEPRLGVAEALDRVGLATIGHLPFGYLSTGQRRRASIARLLVSHRPLWLLDEPTSGFDKASENRFAGLMQAHLEEGGIIVAATHLALGLDGVKTLEMEPDRVR